MTIKNIIFVVLMLACFSSKASTVSSGDVSFSLSGEWEVLTDSSGATKAIQDGANGKRYFLLSLFSSGSPENDIEKLIFIKKFLTDFSDHRKDQIEHTKLTTYKTQRNAPFSYAAYQNLKYNSYFIGAVLGSSKGVVFLTFEGVGDIEAATLEMLSILETMRFSST